MADEKVMAAIRAKCLDCSGHSRKEVERCGFKDCPLWPYRMGCEAKTAALEKNEKQISVFDLMGVFK